MARPTPRDDRTFIELVQDHERAWGTQTYPDRPSLQQILASPVVAFWKPTGTQANDTRSTLSLHSALDDIEQTLTSMLFRGQLQPPTRTLARIFANGKRVRVRRVRIEFDITPDA